MKSLSSPPGKINEKSRIDEASGSSLAPDKGAKGQNIDEGRLKIVLNSQMHIEQFYIAIKE